MPPLVRPGRSPMSFVHDVTPAVFPVMVRLTVRTFPWAPPAPVIANAPAPLAVPTPVAVCARVVVEISRVVHDAGDRAGHRDTGGQHQDRRANQHPWRLHDTLQSKSCPGLSGAAMMRESAAQRSAHRAPRHLEKLR